MLYWLHLKGLLIGSSISKLTKESYQYVFSREMTQIARIKHDTGVVYLRPIDG